MNCNQLPNSQESDAVAGSERAAELRNLLVRLRERPSASQLSKLQHNLRNYCDALAEGNANARSHLAMARSWHFNGRYQDALKCYDRAVSSEPFLPSALSGRASLLATCPLDDLRDGPRALSDAKRAMEGAAMSGELKEEWRLRNYSAVLAAAMAECGDFEGAKNELLRAIDQVQTRTSKAKLTDYLRQVESLQPIRSRYFIC